MEEKPSWKKSRWYTEGKNPEKELRILLSELLEKCLEIENGLSYTEDSDKRPFTNAFNMTDKMKNHNIFIPSIRCKFLELALRKNRIDKAFEIIQKSKLGIFFNATNNEYNSKNLEQCSDKEQYGENSENYECIENILNKKKFKDSCEKCPVKLIYEGLGYIEEQYRIKCKKKILKKYDSSETEKIVEDIYDDIQEFEKKVRNKKVEIKSVEDLFKKCIQCREIKDVSDYKLAYIKWYTARLYTWPYFKSHLLQDDKENEKYDESIVYSLLRSASVICNSMQIIEDEFQLCYNIEMDKIISYLSLAYQNPFIMKYCEKSEEILDSCSRLIKICPESQYQLELYTEMWNLEFHIHKKSDNEYGRKVENLLKEKYPEMWNLLSDTLKESENKYGRKVDDLLKEKGSGIEGERYYTYLYVNNLCKCEKPKLILSAKAYRLRKEKLYNDTIDMITKLFFSKAFAESRNPGLDLIRIKGYDENVKNRDIEDSIIPPSPPSTYQRIYGDDIIISRISIY